ncbi:MAG TPA: FAD-dependent oxidoreductase [Burkholderiaceae bacterium]|jgi:glycine/D-amino acid oxidase-like deaminating enzyme|nr:FAD-dependent oxidoreductase [Burkholderiaceae bacterium]
MTRPVDVAIVGGGVVGCACARAAALAGLRVAVYEAGRVGAGATAAGMGHLVTIDDDPAEFALARLSMKLWRAWNGWDAIERRTTGTLWLAETAQQRDAAHAKLARLRAAGLSAEWLEPEVLPSVEPRLARDLAGALRVAGDEVAYGPELAARLAADVRAAGGHVEEMCPVAALRADGLQLASGGRVGAGHVLLAAGCDSVRLWPGDAPLPLRSRKGQLAITDRYPGYIRHALVELGYIDSAHGDADEAVAFNAQPRASGQVLLGSSRSYRDTSPDVDAALLARMVRRAQRFLPDIASLQMLRCWAGFRPAIPDGRPAIGRIPGERDNHWVATGHEGLGLTTATGTASIWLDLLLGRAPAIDPAPYAPDRFVEVAA